MSDLVEKAVPDTPLPTSQPARTFTRHGWKPEHGDRFSHLSACTSLEVAYEVRDGSGESHGLLTLCLQKALEKLEPDHISKVTFSTMYRCVYHYFCKHKKDIGVLDI